VEVHKEERVVLVTDKDTPDGNNIPEDMSVVTVSSDATTVTTAGSDTSRKSRTRKRQRKAVLKEDYLDIINDIFWESRPWILGP
jgi:hypothetical protein